MFALNYNSRVRINLFEGSQGDFLSILGVYPYFRQFVLLLISRVYTWFVPHDRLRAFPVLLR